MRTADDLRRDSLRRTRRQPPKRGHDRAGGRSLIDRDRRGNEGGNRFLLPFPFADPCAAPLSRPRSVNQMDE